MDGECCGIRKRVRFKGLSSGNGNSGGRTSGDVRSVELSVNGVDVVPPDQCTDVETKRGTRGVSESPEVAVNGTYRMKLSQ